jgi:hypothetical protein
MHDRNRFGSFCDSRRSGVTYPLPTLTPLYGKAALTSTAASQAPVHTRQKGAGRMPALHGSKPRRAAQESQPTASAVGKWRIAPSSPVGATEPSVPRSSPLQGWSRVRTRFPWLAPWAMILTPLRGLSPNRYARFHVHGTSLPGQQRRPIIEFLMGSEHERLRLHEGSGIRSGTV